MSMMYFVLSRMQVQPFANIYMTNTCVQPSHKKAIVLTCMQVSCQTDNIDSVIQSLSKAYDAAHILNVSLVSGGFMCGSNPEQLTFRAKLVARGRQNISSILSYIDDWVESNDVIYVNGALLRLNKSCTISISTLGDDLCDSSVHVELKPSVVSESSPSIGAVVGVLCGTLISAFIIFTYNYGVFRRKMHR